MMEQYHEFDEEFLNADGFLEAHSLKQKLFKFYKPDLILEFNNRNGIKKRNDKKGKDNKEAVPDKNDFCLEIPRNPSQFSVYASIRQITLEDHLMRQSVKVARKKCATFINENNLQFEAVGTDNVSTLPKMVMVGLSGIYELIRETHLTHPHLCSKSLKVLFNVLQNQQPESLKNEPIDIIESLYSLLMDLSQIHEPPPDNSKESCDTIASLACSSLISLVVAFGDPAKILAALSAMFISPNKFSQQHIKIPLILSALHKSVYAILVGRVPLPTWIDEGLKKQADIASFTLKDTIQLSNVPCQLNSSNIASDGTHLYIQNRYALFKVGSGFQSSLMGHIYAFNPEFKYMEYDWIGYCKEQLLHKKGTNDFIVTIIDTNNLLPISEIFLSILSTGCLSIFTDGQELFRIQKANESESYEVFQVIINKDDSSMCSTGLQMKLNKKKMFSCGSSSYDKQESIHEISCENDEEVCSVISCKDFGLLRLNSGHILYRGRGVMLGLKGSTYASKWIDLPIIKSPKIIQMSTGHEGYHACFVSDDGVAYFAGVSKRGEDGESSNFSKVRRAMKAVKPRRMMKVENKHIVSSACNYATTSLITKDGEVYMFGKDAYYCDATGLLCDSKLLDVTNVSMGKAHVIILTKKGLVYSFGLNNKGQCGRGFSTNPDVLFAKTDDAHKIIELDEDIEGEPCCLTGNHVWHYDCCTICTHCKECTGFGGECLNSSKDRNPGDLCGCGVGDPGCLECGICKTCAKKVLSNFDLTKVNEGVKFQGQFFRRPLSRTKNKRSRERVKDKSKIIFPHLSEVPAALSDQEQDAVKLACLPIGLIEIPLSDDEVILQISCGLHHSVMLTSHGNVLVFGSNQFGQLGLGDTLVRNTPTKVNISNIKQVSAGSHHTSLLTHCGQIFTAGSDKNNQLGREINETYSSLSFHPILGIGKTYGRYATWIHANGDQTFFKIDDSLVTANTLMTANVFANSQYIGIVPKNADSKNVDQCIMVDKKNGVSRIYESSWLKGRSFCFDPHFDVIWSYDVESQNVCCLSVIEGVMGERKNLYKSVGNPLDPLFSIPCSSNSSSTRSRVATNVLACLDVMTLGHIINMKVSELETDKPIISNMLSKEDFSVVNRFESHGGGWGYSGQSVEAIRFSCDTDILLGGFGLFGGRGEYSVKIKLFELGAEVLDNEPEGELLAESDEVLFRCPPKEKHMVMFDESILLQSNHWYVAWARISGPSSDCGSCGQTTIFTDDQVTFKFRCSGKSNNGTDVNAGQLPQLLYKIASSTNVSSNIRSKCNQEQSERVLILSRNFTHSVSSTSFESLISLLNWSWSTFCSLGIELDNLKCVSQMVALCDLKRYVYIIETCLRLLRTYISICYPSHDVIKESSRICECVADTRSLLRRIIFESGHIVKEPSPSSNIYQDFVQLKNDILIHCQKTFKTCFRVFYPTDGLKWHCICELLSQFDPAKENGSGTCRLLSCVFEAMCQSSIDLSTIFNIHPKHTNEVFIFEESKTNVPMLINQMIIKLHSCCAERLSFNEIVKKLIEISIYPYIVKSNISQFPQLMINSSSLLSVLIFQLISSSTCSKRSQQCLEKPIFATPSRFSRISQGVFWNSGNGSPDAVCFSVDKAGIVIVGVGFYAGGEGTSTFELEILADHSIGKVNDSSDIHWGCIELVKGSYDIDDCINDIVQVKFNKPVVTEENVKYALRLRNYCNRTRNGDDGLNRVTGPDGTTFIFSSCSLSINGTNHMRGQLPIILYQSTQQNNDLISESNKALQEQEAQRNLMFVVLEVFKSTIQVMLHLQQSFDLEMLELLSEFPFVQKLIPLMCSSIITYLIHDLHNCVEILPPLSTLLSHVTNLQQTFNLPRKLKEQEKIVLVESEHPYKPATVAAHCVKFPDEVQWMSVEFDLQSSTSQPEDHLQIYLPHPIFSLPQRSATHDYKFVSKGEDFIEWIPVYKKMFGMENWPTMALILPGNELRLSLQSSSCSQKEEKSTSFGFKCQISGFQGIFESEKGWELLEKELITLSSKCAEMLLRKDIIFPFCKQPEKDTIIIENSANEMYKLHSSLLIKSFPLLYLPTIHEALDGKLPIDNTSHQKKFLIDFIQKNPGTSGGRLAVWLQPEPYLDPKNCKVACAKKDLFCGWPCLIFIQARDQYGCPADLSNLKLEAKAILMLKSTSDYKLNYPVPNNSVNCGSPCFGGHPPPKLEVPYHPSVREKKEVYHSITMMKEFEIYSFEELRFSTSMIMKPTENMSIKNELDGSYTASWNPNSAGFYDILITVDGIRIGEPLKILVKEAPHGNFPQLSNPLKNSEIKPYKQSRQFICKQSAGLRIRLHPSLQSEQIGILENNAIISFTTQLQNDDGTWLKLSPDTMRKCHLPYNGSNEGWALQYHQHLRKTFLFPLQDKNKENIYNNFSSKVSSMRNLKENKIFEKDFPKTFVASKCGPHGHKILKSPKIDSTTIGKITQGTQISAVREKKTNEGVWLELNDKCKDNYCFNQSEEAWCLAESGVGDIFFTCFKRNHRCLKNEVVINNTNIEEHSEDNFNSRKKNGESQINGNGITPPATPKKTLLKEECNRHCDSNLNDRQIETASKMNFILRKVIKVSTENQSRSNSCSPPRSNNLYKKLRSSSMPASDVSSKGFSVLVPRDHKKALRKQKLKINSEKGNPSPAVPEIPIVSSNSTKTPTNKVMSPSLAECLRAMFAAFLWHKDIVQDAMACASFLKFHPAYVKDSIDLSDKSNTEEYHQDPKSSEQNGLNVIFNSFKKSSHTNLIDSLTPEKPHIPKLSTLVHLLFFWDQLNVATIKAIEESFKLTMPTDDSEHLFLKKSDNDNFEWSENVSLQSPNQKSTKKENPCDLCGISSSPPITYHMRQFHPGCGKNAGGQGYNSEGAYCDGWAGKCGDGGKHTSTWYLMCASCKEYYHSKWQGSNNLEMERNSSKAERKNSPTFCLAQIFTMLKNNALFILDLNFFNSSIKSEFETPENDDCIFKCSPSQMPFIFLDMCKLNNNPIQRDHIDIKSSDKNNERNHTGERPRSIYEGYKFDVSHASTTLYNLNFMRETEYSNEFQFPFHRSISEMGPALGREGNRQNLKNETFLKETKTSKGLSLLNHPSFQLSSMIQSMNKWMNCNDKPFFEYILEQPFMKFCIQSHDLEHLVTGMKLALCKATCRTYALQAFNWLMRKVTLQSCLHDLLWYFVSSLMLQPYEMKLVQQQENLNKGRQSDFECDVEVICRHPLDDIPLAEGLSKVVIYCFHTFLQSLSDIMMFLPRGTSVQQMAVKCWSLKFKPSDHEFLHQSDIFKSISKILSESEQTTSEFQRVDYMLFVETLRDLTLLMEINVSTHQQMLSSITDYSTETFWESGDDDRNKIKTISFIFNDECVPQLVCVYVDNVKDHGNKVSSVLVSSGLNQEEVQMDAQQEFDLRHVGWMNIWLNKKKRNCIKLAVKGPDSSLRIRQVKLLGHIVTSVFEIHSGLDSYELQCLNCETETLRVFKFLTTQVFKSLITSEENCDERHVTGKMEHVVGILFSQQKLTNMQKQVCAHILHAIRKETIRVREAWEFSKITEFSDNYCFELLNLVLALSGSTAGCAFVAQQLCLLEDLLTLLHTSSARVQRQVVLLLRRLLVHIKPGTFAEVQNISISDFETMVDYRSNFMEHVGIMDVFLICIVKCLSVQIKKCKTVIDSIPFSDFASFSDIICSKVIPLKWWYNGSASTQLAELVITLLKDISDGKLTEEWATITKKAIAGPILILSQMPEEYRSCDNCIRTPVLWMTLAALCVLNEEHMSHLSPCSLPSSVPQNITCDNHDDGYTVAIMKCSVCGDLCAECDRVLHLSRKTKIHQRHIFVEEREIVKVDCLEGCGRIKLFWILASSDSRNLKAVIEFRDEDSFGWPHIRSNQICRFCGIFFIHDTDTNTQVCKSPECSDLAKKACLNILTCGHLCGGIRDELTCLPCLHGCKNQEVLLLKQDADDMCMICFSDTLSRAPSIQLACGHVFHMHCCEKILLSKWTGPRITFGFSLCPICKAPISHSSLNTLLKPIRDRFDDVKRKALMRLEYEGLSCSESIVTPGFPFYNDPTGYAMHRYAYYVCSKCDKAYFGGEVRCEDQAIGGPQAAEGYDVSELVCGACSDVSRAQICPKHGVDFLEYKCRYCCSVAVFFCFGTTHFCSSCHDDFQRITAIPINDLPRCPAGPKTRQLEGQCPLAVTHPSTGTEFALGCGVCRNAHSF